MLLGAGGTVGDALISRIEVSIREILPNQFLKLLELKCTFE